MTKLDALKLAVAAASLLGYSAPALATETTAPEFVSRIEERLAAGDISGARHALRHLQTYGVETLNFGGHAESLETLINWLGDPLRISAVIARLQHPGPVVYGFCKPRFISALNLAAPPPWEVFPVGSAGCPA